LIRRMSLRSLTNLINWSWKPLCILLLLVLVLRSFTSFSDSSFLQLNKKSIFDGKVRDCRTWEVVDFVMLKDAQNGFNVEVVDQENPENRLESWKKDWDNQIPNIPKSGDGSTVEVTQNMRLSLATIIEKLKLELNKGTINFLDSPSGDMTWMPILLQSRTDVKYTGYDLIPQNILLSNTKFADKDWTFKQFDMMKDRVDSSYDLILNRHVSIHLGLLDSIQMFYNFMASGSKFLVTTTYPDVAVNDQLAYSNQEVSGRGFHRVNLHLYPFNFPKPICQNFDAPGQSNQHLALWRLEDLEEFFNNNKHRFREFEK